MHTPNKKALCFLRPVKSYFCICKSAHFKIKLPHSSLEFYLLSAET